MATTTRRKRAAKKSAAKTTAKKSTAVVVPYKYRAIFEPVMRVRIEHDPLTNYDTGYDDGVGAHIEDGKIEVTIGCETHTAAWWREHGAAIVRREFTDPVDCDCGDCDPWRDDSDNDDDTKHDKLLAEQRTYVLANLNALLDEADRVLGPFVKPKRKTARKTSRKARR